MTNEELTAILQQVLAHAPAWLRHDLASTDAAARARAEDTLAAQIAAVLSEEQGPQS